ncbi:MAG TPA: homoserine O-acetyltransferase [Longimicrobium sp.]|uniref:homoserine O-acetyltransferase family protein n=1 Tax=Longimicrobium sp. TaxID=2029185 RepID=UPI002EDA449B
MNARELRTQHVPAFTLESGEVLRGVRQAYHLDGALNAARDNLVLIVHALTGSADAAGDWWRAVIGPGLAVNTDRYAVLCTNLLGSCYGTTGPSEPGRDEFPLVTTRDQARLIHGLVEELGVRSVALVAGGSLGGMVAMEWAAAHPDAFRSAVVFAAPAAHTASAIAWNHIQRQAIQAAGERGLEIARMVGMMTYRTAEEQEVRFGRGREEDGRWSMASYLEHHGRKLRARFDLRSYVALTHAMDSHDVARGRGGAHAALAPVADRMTGVGIPGDLLYSAADVRAWTDASGAAYREIHSIHGHDAFLLEPEQAGRILADALAGAEGRPKEHDDEHAAGD